MAWFALARILFVAAVAYAAAVLQPLPVAAGLNVAFALALAGLAVFFESRLRETSVTRILGALIGCAIGLLLSRAMAIPIEPALIYLFMPSIFLVASLPVFYMGWGGREAVVIMTLLAGVWPLRA